MIDNRNDATVLETMVPNKLRDNENFEAFYPLSSDKLLRISMQEGSHSSLQATRAIVQGANTAIAASAERYLYAHLNDKRIERLAKRFKGMRPNINVVGFGPKRYARTVVPRRWRDA
jgi:hypothetical protein